MSRIVQRLLNSSSSLTVSSSLFISGTKMKDCSCSCFYDRCIVISRSCLTPKSFISMRRTLTFCRQQVTSKMVICVRSNLMASVWVGNGFKEMVGVSSGILMENNASEGIYCCRTFCKSLSLPLAIDVYIFLLRAYILDVADPSFFFS